MVKGPLTRIALSNGLACLLGRARAGWSERLSKVMACWAPSAAPAGRARNHREHCDSPPKRRVGVCQPTPRRTAAQIAAGAAIETLPFPIDFTGTVPMPATAAPPATRRKPASARLIVTATGADLKARPHPGSVARVARGRARTADQRHQQKGGNKQAAEQHDRVVVGQHQRFALHQISEQLDRRAAAVTREKRI
jgi:hypothetical protein